MNAISLRNDESVIGYNNASSIEEGEVTFILPSDNYYSASFELDTDCGILENISSHSFSKLIKTIPIGMCPKGSGLY